MRTIAILLTGAALCGVQPSYAQQVQKTAAEPQGDDIIVTGEKSNRTLQQTTTSTIASTLHSGSTGAVGVGTAVASSTTLATTMQDVYNRTANVSETYGAAGFTIRGISNSGVGAGGNADTASVYIDGAPITREALFGGPTDLWDVGQVEILRGPQSTIQGLNALAGAIVITTRDPSTTEYSADGRILWTNQNDRTFSAAVGGPRSYSPRSQTPPQRRRTPCSAAAQAMAAAIR